MAETQGVANFVDIGLEGIAVEIVPVGRQPVRADIHAGRGNETARCRIRPGKRPVLVIIEGDLATDRDLIELDTGDVFPELERRPGEGLARQRQRRDIDSDRIAG